MWNQGTLCRGAILSRIGAFSGLKTVQVLMHFPMLQHLEPLGLAAFALCCRKCWHKKQMHPWQHHDAGTFGKDLQDLGIFRFQLLQMAAGLSQILPIVSYLTKTVQAFTKTLEPRRLTPPSKSTKTSRQPTRPLWKSIGCWRTLWQHLRWHHGTHGGVCFKINIRCLYMMYILCVCFNVFYIQQPRSSSTSTTTKNKS